MPADSKTLEDEGVVIAPQPLDEDAIERARRADAPAHAAARRPARPARRQPHRRQRGSQRAARADAAGRGDGGDDRLRRAPHPRGDRGARGRHARGARTCSRPPTATSQLSLTATVDGDELHLDFTGTADQHDGNLNCPLAVTVSACWFAVRVLTDPDIPPSSGAMRPVTVTAPEGCLLNATLARRGRGGQRRDSSRVADLVLKAFGRALGQGTMNNLTLGNDDFTYYETLGGGQGACADADGPSGVHVAMSNTLNTPVEALELEFPLRVVTYALRRGSGGDGEHRGGDGVIREVEALAEMDYSLLTERRRHAPPGADGGEPGARGPESAGRRGAARRRRAVRLEAGQRLRIETPGGGGYG